MTTDSALNRLTRYIDPSGNNSRWHGTPMFSTAAAVMVVQENKVLLEEYMGHFGPLAGHRPVGPDSRFGLWSSTKQWYALALLRLMDEGLIGSLDDPVSRYIPEFSGYGGGDIYEPGAYPRDPITIRQVYSRTSGILQDPHSGGGGRYKWMYVPIEKEPGTYFRYNDYNKTLEIEMLARAAKLDPHTVMERYVFQPLHMTGTGYYTDPSTGWYRGGGQLEYALPVYRSHLPDQDGSKGAVYPRCCNADAKSQGFSGIFYSTARDCAAFSQAWLDALAGQPVVGRRWCSPELAKEATSPQPPGKKTAAWEDELSRDMEGWTMGLRWWIRMKDGLLMSSGKSQTRIYVYPPKQAFAVVLRNSIGLPADYGKKDYDHLGDLFLQSIR